MRAIACAVDFVNDGVQCILNASCSQAAVEACGLWMTGGSGAGGDPMFMACGSFPAAFMQEMDSCIASFTCNNGEQIDMDWVCDGVVDCEDGSDEDGCGGSSSDGFPFEADFSCGSGEMIPVSWLCDGMTDCLDGSDEAGCGGSA